MQYGTPQVVDTIRASAGRVIINQSARRASAHSAVVRQEIDSRQQMSSTAASAAAAASVGSAKTVHYCDYTMSRMVTASTVAVEVVKVCYGCES